MVEVAFLWLSGALPDVRFCATELVAFGNPEFPGTN